MRKIATITIITLLLMGSAMSADEVFTLEEAKTVSARTGKLILIKFFTEN